MNYKTLGKTDTRISVIGQGCMGIGGYLTRDSKFDKRQAELLRFGIELGMTFIDTAEVYGAGHSEEVVGKAVKRIRDGVFIATKVSPEHLNYSDVIQSAEKSLRRLNTDHIDLYQVHWPNPAIDLQETMRAMEELVQQGKIRYIGLSNLCLNGLEKAQMALTQNMIVSIQAEYNLFDRSVEHDILPFCDTEGVTLIAYSPLEQGRIVSSSEKIETLEAIAAKYDRTMAQVTLNWLTAHDSVIAIPKASNLRHLKENAFSVDFGLSQEDFDKIGDVMYTECIAVPTERIRVAENGQGNRQVYQTKEQAIENRLGFVPSPVALASSIGEEDFTKPVRVIRTADRSGRYDYDLVEGRIRYWAWVIAHDGKKPIPAYVRDDLKRR